MELVHGSHGQSERWVRAWQIECVGLCAMLCGWETGLRRDISMILTQYLQTEVVVSQVILF